MPLLLLSSRDSYRLSLSTGAAAAANGAVSSTAAGGGAFSSATGGSGQKAQIDAGGTQRSSAAAAAEQAASSGEFSHVALDVIALIEAMSPMRRIRASRRDLRRLFLRVSMALLRCCDPGTISLTLSYCESYITDADRWQEKCLSAWHCSQVAMPGEISKSMPL